MADKKPASSGEEQPQDQSERERQRATLQRVLSKSKAKLSSGERQLMEDLVAELDLLHLRQSDLDRRFSETPALRDLIMLAQEEDDQEIGLTSKKKEAKSSAPSSGLARVPKEQGPPPEGPQRYDVTSSSVARVQLDVGPLQPAQQSRPQPPAKPRHATSRVAKKSEKEPVKPPRKAHAKPKASKPQPPPPRVAPRARQDPPPRVVSKPREKPPLKPRPAPRTTQTTSGKTSAPFRRPSLIPTVKRPNPDITVRKFVEAWNQKAFAAEFSCYARRTRTMDKDAYIERRMEVYLSETQQNPVTKVLGGILSKRVYGDNSEVLCERIIRENLDMEWSLRAQISSVDENLLKLLHRSGCRKETGEVC